MIALVQRVTSASVSRHTGLKDTRSIDSGLCVFLGALDGDTEIDVEKMSQKLSKLRIFSDTSGKMNLDIKAVGGSILLISQFTLAADLSAGNRPSFIKASPSSVAQRLYESLIISLQSSGIGVKSGFFGEHMDVDIHNDGPVTIIVDSNKI